MSSIEKKTFLYPEKERRYLAKRTLFIANHPHGAFLVPPVLHMLHLYPNTSLVAWEGLAKVPGISVIPVPIKQDTLPLLSKIVQKIQGVPPKSNDVIIRERAEVIHKMIHEIRQDRNVFICPGTKSSGEEFWRPGIGKVIHQMLEEPPISLSFMYASMGGYYLTDPIHTTELIPDLSNDMSPEEITTIVRECYINNYDGSVGDIKGLHDQ